MRQIRIFLTFLVVFGIVIVFGFPTSAHAQQFGGVVAASGDQIFVGDGQPNNTPGSVYVFSQESGGQWNEVARLSAKNNEGEVDGFGSAISVHKNTLIVGAPSSGMVHIFTRSDGAPSDWQWSSSIESDDEGFGSGVSLSGEFLLIATPESDDSAGTVDVMRRTPAGAWRAAGSLEATDKFDGDHFGQALAIHGHHAIVSAPGREDGSGAVFAFAFDSETDQWGAATALPIQFKGEQASAGSSLLIVEDQLAVGVPGFANGTGTVVLFSLQDDSNNWSFSGRVSPYASVRAEKFGSSIARTPDALWIGSPGVGGRRGTGAVYRFDLDDSGNVLGSQIMDAPELHARSQFGAAIAASDILAVVGAPGYDNRAGVAFPFSTSSGDWVAGSALVNETFGYDSVSGGIVECTEDLAGDFPCKDVDMTSFISMKDLGADRGVRTNDLWGWEDPETGREYAIVGLSNQTSFVDVTDPYNPVFLGELDMPATANMSVWRDMKVYKNHAFIVSDGAGEHGIQIFDLTQLRNVTTPVTFEETAHYPGIFSAHNIVINEDTGFAYSVGSSSGGKTCGGGLHMIDIRDPANPVFAGCFSDGETGRRGTGYSHDAQCVLYHGPDSDYSGHEICVGSNETAISIADVTNKDNPVSVAMGSYPNVAYAHQGWFTDDHRYFYLNDEIDEARDLVEGTRTLIWDLEDLDEPVLAGEHIAKTTETDHNLYVKGNLMYQSNTAAGLRILDISDPENPFETAFFDTSPVGGRGVSWSNYPYFKNGMIAVTGGHYGLFLLKKKEVDI